MPESLRRGLLLGPGLTWLALFLVVPTATVLLYSFFERGTYGGIDTVFNVDNYVRAVDPLYFGILLKSLRIAAIATAAALVIGYPVAYLIATAPKRLQIPLLLLVMLPFWSNYLIRTYAWIVLLNREGLINNALRWLGLVDEPLSLLYNDTAIVIGLVYGYLPFMVLPLYASIARLNPEIREAATDLGASSLRGFWTVTVPLTRQAIAAGCIFVFVPSIGNFITPDLLGGGRTKMIGNLIYDQFLKARDWPFGSTLALILIGVMMVLLFLQAWFVNRQMHGAMARARIERQALRAHAALVYLFLYGPIAVLVVLSFNESGLPTAWGGFSTRWYAALADATDIHRAVLNTLIVAVSATAVASFLGTLLALGLERLKPRSWIDGLMFVPMIVPDIVLAIALLSFYTLLEMTLGLHSIIFSHIVFNIAFVAVVVRTRLRNFDKSIVEASIDLGASEVGTFLRITLPVIAPGVIAGALIAFTLSIDEFVIAFFTAGAGPSSTTFPMLIYSMIRFGVTPEINAIATIVLFVSFTLILISQRINRPVAKL